MSINTAADVFAHRLPVLVKQVQARIARSHELWDLPGKCVRLLQILATYTPLESPHLPLIFNRAKPAGLLNVSVRTIDRCLGTLSERGLIVRMKQKRHGPGQWDCTSIRWTEVCVNKLFAQTPAASTPPRPAKNIAHGATDLAHKTTPSSKEEVVKKPSTDGSPEKQAIANLKKIMPRVPIDLIEPALSLALSRIQITTLMCRCREIKQRLQDVFTVTKGTLDQQMLKGRDAMAWLLKVISSGQDFKWLSKQKTILKASAHRQQRQAHFTDQVITALSKTSIALPDGTYLNEVLAGMAYVFNPSNNTIASRPVAQLAHKFIKQSPGWIKQLIREGTSNNQVQTQAQAQTLKPPMQIFEARVLPNTEHIRSKMADLKAMLKRGNLSN
jgi:hypothetical protein